MRFGRRSNSYGRRRGVGGGMKARLIIGLLFAAFALFSYYTSGEVNPVTGETQRVAISEDQEIALGLQAAPEMAAQHGGLAPDASKQERLDRIGARLITQSLARDTEWQYDFHVLSDNQTVNAFALPGGQMFITQALMDKLPDDDHIAAVMAHEMVHVIARHGAQRMAKQQLTQGLTGAAVMASGSHGTGQMAAMIGNMVNMRYGRDDEIESDSLGVKIMHQAGYNPNAMIGVQQILAEAAGGERPPEFFSTHPSPENRIEKIKEAIDNL